MTVLTLVFESFLYHGCDDSDPIKANGNDSPHVPTTPKENREAEEAALWLSEELYAPDTLYETIKSDLAAIRNSYIGTIPVDIQFRAWWSPSILGITVTEETRQKLLNNEHTVVDSLNSVFSATHMDTFRLNVGTFTVINFEGRFHPDRLAEIYESIDDVVSASHNSWIGDYSNVYPWKLDKGNSYLFREGSGDCMMGCIHNRFWYFRVDESDIDFVGYWDHLGPEPDWWEEGKVAWHQFLFCEFHQFTEYCYR